MTIFLNTVLKVWKCFQRSKLISKSAKIKNLFLLGFVKKKIYFLDYFQSLELTQYKILSKSSKFENFGNSEFSKELETLTQMYGQPKILPVRNGIPLSWWSTFQFSRKRELNSQSLCTYTRRSFFFKATFFLLNFFFSHQRNFFSTAVKKIEKKALGKIITLFP